MAWTKQRLAELLGSGLPPAEVDAAVGHASVTGLKSCTGEVSQQINHARPQASTPRLERLLCHVFRCRRICNLQCTCPDAWQKGACSTLPGVLPQAYQTMRKGNKIFAVYDLAVTLDWAGRWLETDIEVGGASSLVTTKEHGRMTGSIRLARVLQMQESTLASGRRA